MSLPSPPSNEPTSNTLRRSIPNGAPVMHKSWFDDGDGGAPSHALPHIKDIEERSVRGLSTNHSISQLVTTALASWKQALFALDHRKPDLSYLEYLRTYEIVVTYIPQSPSYPDFKAKKSSTWQSYWNLAKEVSERTEQFEKLKQIIIHDNKRNGTSPPPPASLVPGPQRLSMDNPTSSLPSSTIRGSKRSSRMDSYAEGDDAHLHAAATIAGISSGPTSRPHDSAKPKPPVSPKPPALHGHALQSKPVSSTPNGTAERGYDTLSDRFARLRTGNPTTVEMPDPRVLNGAFASSPTESSGKSSFETLSPVKSESSAYSRPTGPRPMQNGAPLRKAVSGLAIDAQLAAAMPKAPSPTYSPARNMQTSGNVQPPRSTARSIVGTGGRSNSLASSVSSIAPGVDSEAAGYFPKPTTNGTPRDHLVSRKSVHVPRETRVGPERLYDYLKMHDILLIDVRNRRDFDDGHIYAPSVICIDPAGLRRDMSADDLQDSLVLSPDAEQAMFFDRDRYDLVVYYDQSTSSDHYLHHPKSEQDYSLRFLHDALYEYNEGKPLQRPPILLMGGIEAWADLVGDQALVTSNTVARSKQGRPIRRAPVPDGRSRLRNPKKRDYNPIDAEEARNWRERARKESVTVSATAEHDSPTIDEEDETVQTEEPESFLETINEFNQRFPEAGFIGRQAFMDQLPSRPPPAPPKIPIYPTAPPPSAHNVPARPAPAAPRMSYSGVNERSVSQSAKTAELPAYVPTRFQPQNVRLPRTGLVNFGVTCYMNATIQALSATTPLSTFFLDDGYRSQVQRDNWKGSKGVLPDLYANLVRSIWKGDVEAIRPSTLRAFCTRLNREWGIDRQQDAKEFFDFIVDCLHEDFNANWSRTPLRALSTEEEIKREKMPKLVVCKREWDRYTHREKSYVTSLFAGQHASRLRCTTCQFTSTTYEAFYSISVEIPKTGVGSIEDCLKSYCAEERLSGDEVWKCPHCKKEREATKQITITRAPQFLVIHFKRFSAGRGESARKIRTPINFPLQDLDLDPYVLPPPTAAESQAIARDFGAQELKTDASMSGPYSYDAYAVMRHIGTTLTSGHYTCLARDRARKCWRQYNDTHVGDFDPERMPERDRLQNEMAYIVFYQRK